MSRYPVTPLEVPDRYYLVAPLQELGTNLLNPHPRSVLGVFWAPLSLYPKLGSPTHMRFEAMLF